MIEINKKKLCESCFAETDSEVCPKCGFNKSDYTADPLVLPMGTKLDDKIVIGRVMGKGGFGVTYLGYDLRMDKTIAVKEYYPNGIAYRSPSGTEVSVADTKSAETFEKGAEKFYTEAEMVAQFNGNPNIVSVYDYFRANNTVYLIMEYLSGITLKNYVKKHGRLTDGQALFVIDKIAAALSITHSAGVLHRDISPDNIMICMDGKIKLIDFGAARQIMAESSSNLTVVMKPGYTPIEQYTKKGRQGAWTDIYSLGVSVYYALTEVIIDDPYARMDDDSELAENRHGINNDLWTILKKCTMINASDRYGSAIDLRKALKSVSAPIKSEPIGLSDDDLKSDDNSNAPEEPAEVTAEKECPVTMAAPVSDAPETIEVFEDEAADTAPAPLDVPAPVDDKKAAVGGNNADKGKIKDKRFIIGGICAAAVIVIGIIGIIIAGNKPDDSETITANVPDISETTADTTVGTTESVKEKKPETTTSAPKAEVKKDGKSIITIDDDDLAWSMSKIIQKSTLDKFDGDIRVTMKLSQMDMQKSEDGNYYHSFRVLDGKGRDVNVTAVGKGKDEYDIFNIFKNGDSDFVFIIPHDLLGFIYDNIHFETENVIVKSVILEDDTYDKVIELSGKYPDDDWGITEDNIPLSELNCYDGDVRITLDLEIGTFQKGEMVLWNDDPDFPFSWVTPVNKDYVTLDFDADNMEEYGDPNDVPFVIGKGNRKFSFTISQDELNKNCQDGIYFQVSNAVVKRAYIEGTNGSKRKDSTSASAEDITETTPTVTEPEVTTVPETTTAEAVTTTAPPVTTAKATTAASTTTTKVTTTTTKVMTTTTTEPEVIEKPLYVPLSTKYPGGADRVNTLHKNYLKHFTGDIKVVLDLEVVYVEKNDEGGYWHSLRITDGRGDAVNVHAVNVGRDYWNGYGINHNQTEFTFIVKRADIDNTYNEFMFHVDNLIVKGATVYDYDPNEYKISPNAKIIQLDSKYPGMYQDSSPIPKKELESFNGDVKVTLSIERFNDEKEDLTVNGKKMHWVSIQPFSGENKVYTKADNISLWEDFSFELRYVDVPDKFTFVISKSEISKLTDNGLTFKCRNVIIKSAALEKA